MNRDTILPGGTEDFQQRVQAKDTVREYQEALDPTLQSAQSKLEDARAALAREQDRLDMTPRVTNGKHNQAYGAQINIRDSAHQTVESVEQELTKAQNDFARRRYLARLDAQKQAAIDEREAPQRERAAQDKAAFLASAKTRWLAAGGSEHAFNENSESLWTTEVMKRMQAPDAREQTKQQLARSGRYSL
jgi:hypothetical protein